MPSFEMGVRGLRLRLGFLRSAGVAPHLLENWFEGKRLGAKTSVPKRFSNHPSVATYSEWAEREVDRLEGLGKVSLPEVGEFIDPTHPLSIAKLLVSETLDRISVWRSATVIASPKCLLVLAKLCALYFPVAWSP